MEPRVAEADKFWGRKTVSFSFAKMHCGPVLVTGKQACFGGGASFVSGAQKRSHCCTKMRSWFGTGTRDRVRARVKEPVQT